jgi:hypothetical protein
MADAIADLVVKLRADFGDAQGQFDALMEQLKQVNARTDEGKQTIENLGKAFEAVLPPIASMNVSTQAARVSIDDFMAGLEKGIDEKFGATSIEEAAAAQKANEDAMRSAAEASEKLGDEWLANEEMTQRQKDALEDLKDEYRKANEEQSGFGEKAQEIIDQQAALQANLVQTAEALQELYLANQEGRIGAEVLAAAQEELAVALKKVQPEVEHETEGLKELAMEMVELAGIAVTAEKIKELGEESVIAYGKEEELTLSMDLLGAGAEGAGEKVEELKNLSNQLAVPFEQLSSKARELSAIFGTGGNLNAVLIAAGNASAATGRSFTALAGAIERVEQSGQVGQRQLATLGIAWKDLAETMGVSIEEAQQKMKKGAQSASDDVATVIDTIDRKFKDAAEKRAELTLGQITILKNRIEFMMADIGGNFKDIVSGIFIVVQVTAEVINRFIEQIAEAIDIIIGMVMIAISALTTIGKVAADVMKGDLKAAITDGAIGYGEIKGLVSETTKNLISEQERAAKVSEGIWKDNTKKILAQFESTDKPPTGKEKPDKFKTTDLKDYSVAIQELIAESKLYVSEYNKAIDATALFNKTLGTHVTTVDRLAMETGIATEQVRKFGEHAGDGIPEVQAAYIAWDATLQKTGAQIQKLTDTVTEDHRKMLESSPWGVLATAAEHFGITTDHALKLAMDESIKQFKLMQASGVATYRELSIAALKMTQDQINYMRAVGQITNEEYTKLTADIKSKLDQLEGNTKTTTKKMKDDLTEVAKVVTNDLVKGIDALIFQTGKLADTFKKMGKDIADVFEKQAIKALTDWLVHLIQGHAKTMGANAMEIAARIKGITTVTTAEKAAAATSVTTETTRVAAITTLNATSQAEKSAADVVQIQGQAALAFAATFASVMAALPFPVNAATAPEAAGVAQAAVEAMIPLAVFAKGGDVPYDMFAMVHAGEHVLDADISAELRNVIAAGKSLSGGGSGIHIHFNGNVSGVTQDMVKSVFNKGIRQARLGGATKL